MNTASEESVELNKYELMLIFLPDLGEEGINKELEEIEKHIKGDGGEIFNKDIWGNRDLAYRIKRQAQGYYLVLNFTLPSENISELEKSLNIHPGVIRFLLTRIPLNYTLKTFVEYQAEVQEAAKQKAAERKVKEEAKKAQMKKSAPGRSKPEPEAPKAKIEKKFREAPVVEEVKVEEIETPRKTKKTTEKSKLEEVDEKLKNIINDPDISL